MFENLHVTTIMMTNYYDNNIIVLVFKWNVGFDNNLSAYSNS